MSTPLPVPASDAAPHPVSVVVVSASDLDASREFYREIFGWPTRQLSDVVAVTFAASGPSVVLRRYIEDDHPAVVPILQVADVDRALDEVVRQGGSSVGTPYDVPLGGRIVRFTDPSGVTYGLTSNTPVGSVPQVPIPLDRKSVV